VLNKNLLLLTYILFLNLQSQELETLSYSHLNQGSIKVITDLHSNFVEDRNLEVWLPPNFNPESNYDLLIMHDGQNLFDGTKTWNKQEWKLDEWASKLIPEKKVKPFIIVGIYNSGENRWNDYFPENAYEFVNDKRYIDNNRPKLYANAYLKYIVNELIPFVKLKYLRSKDDFETVIGGSSMGGLISMYAVFEYPKIFDAAICMSTHWTGAFVINNNPLPDAIFKYMSENIPKSNGKKFYFDYGDQGLDENYPQYSKKVDSIFLNNGYSENNYKNLYFKNEWHSEDSWNKRVNIPLKFTLN
jgi:predicted alpha/beta superfamily hydrolase